MTREEAYNKIPNYEEYISNKDYMLDIFEKLGIIKFDKPETKLEKFTNFIVNKVHHKINSIERNEIIDKVKEIYGED